jgi:transposase InsO family protein
VATNPDAHPLFHSDGGSSIQIAPFPKIEATGMTQSMSRIGKCIDKSPMEGFWGILKRTIRQETPDKDSLVQMIKGYIHYYNTRRLQRNLGILTPMENTINIYWRHNKTRRSHIG